MTSAAPTEPGASEDVQTVLFRPTKKRKFYRQRGNDDTDSAVPLDVSTTASRSGPLSDTVSGATEVENSDEVEGARVSIAEILRLRKQQKRVGGVEFRATPVTSAAENTGALVIARSNVHDSEVQESAEGAMAPAPRFMKQTGMTGDVDKHMMAYIDSQLAKQRQAATSTTQTPTLEETQSQEYEDRRSRQDGQKQPATLGKIQEIDLGAEARDRNASATEMARRRAIGEPVDDMTQSAKPKKVRLGPDGKPWRSRKRRGSEDVKRDAIVEAVLRENRIDMYEEPVVKPNTTVSNGESGENDDRIAEEFRREFLDAVSQRRRKKTVAPPTRGPTGKVEEELKGPKLGGSRSARAAMREMQLKAQKK